MKEDDTDNQEAEMQDSNRKKNNEEEEEEEEEGICRYYHCISPSFSVESNNGEEEGKEEIKKNSNGNERLDDNLEVGQMLKE